MAHRFLGVLFPDDRHHVAGLDASLKRVMPESGRVLDMGCGDNAALARFRTERREVWGADFREHSRLQHREWFRQLEPSGAAPFDDASFDVIVSVMVLEHVAHPQAYLREVNRLLRPGGHFVGHTISGSHYVTWLRRVVGLFPHSFSQWIVRTLYGRAAEDTFPAHYRLNRRSQIERACASAGFERPEIERYADPGYFDFFAPFEVLAIIVDRLLEAMAPGWGRLYLTVTTRKVPNRRRSTG